MTRGACTHCEDLVDEFLRKPFERVKHAHVLTNAYNAGINQTRRPSPGEEGLFTLRKAWGIPSGSCNSNLNNTLFLARRRVQHAQGAKIIPSSRCRARVRLCWV